MAVFWVAALCSLVEIYRRFRGACCIRDQCPEERQQTPPPRNVGKLLPDYMAQQCRRLPYSCTNVCIIIFSHKRAQGVLLTSGSEAMLTSCCGMQEMPRHEQAWVSPVYNHKLLRCIRDSTTGRTHPLLSARGPPWNTYWNVTATYLRC
jgi:hypothetical protein